MNPRAMTLLFVNLIYRYSSDPHPTLYSFATSTPPHHEIRNLQYETKNWTRFAIKLLKTSKNVAHNFKWRLLSWTPHVAN